VATVKGGTIRKRAWRHEGRLRSAWGYTLIVDGKQIRRQGFVSREEAQGAMEAYKAEVCAPLVAALPSMTLAQAVDRYAAEKSRKKGIAETSRVLRVVWLPALGAETALSDITADRIAAWKATRMTSTSRQTKKLLSLASINRPLASLRAVLRMAAREWRVLETVPYMKTEPESSRLRWLKPEEAERLLAACRASRNGDLADLVEFSLFTGLRQGEALGLTWDRVERARGVVLVTETKTGKDREVPLNTNADAILERRAAAEGLVFGTLSFDSFRTAWETAVRKAKLTDFRFHDLRHTCASWMVQRGANLQEVKDVLGHSTLAMTLRYAHLAPEHLRKAVSALDGMLHSTTAAHGASESATAVEEWTRSA